MITSNPKMLRCFKWILLVAIVQFLIHFVVDYYHLGAVTRLGEAKSPYRFVIYFPVLITILAMWLSVGYIFDCKKEALIGMILSFMVLGINIFVLRPGLDGSSTTSRILIRTALSFIPYLTFGYLLFKDKRLWTILLFSFVFNGVFLLAYGDQLVKFLNDFFGFFGLRDLLLYEIPTGEKSYRYFYPLSSLFRSFSLPVLFLVFCHMIYALKNKHAYLSGRSIDLSNIYSKKLASVIYFILRFSLLVMLFGVVMHFSFMPAKQINNQVQLFIRGFGILVSFYLIALTYRNFLTEYLISRNREPGWLYLAWNLPIIGTISWLISLLSLGKIIPLADRIKRFKSAQENFNGGIQFAIILIFFLLSIDQLTRLGSNTAAIMTYLLIAVISVSLFIWYFRHPSGLWALIAISFIQLLLIVFFEAPKNSYSGYSAYFVNIPNVVVFFSLFHMAYLKNEAVLMPSEEEGGS